MPTDACQFFYDCKGCGERLKPILKRRVSGTLVGVHATLVVSGFVVLAAFVLVG